MDIRETLQFALEYAIKYTHNDSDKEKFLEVQRLSQSDELFMCEKITMLKIIEFGEVFTRSEYQSYRFKYCTKYISIFHQDDESILI